MSTAPALGHRALVVREARMEDAETRRCYGSRVLAAVGTGAGVSLTSLSELRGRENSLGHLCDPSRCILHRQEGIQRERGKDGVEIFMVGERVRG